MKAVRKNKVVSRTQIMIHLIVITLLPWYVRHWDNLFVLFKMLYIVGFLGSLYIIIEDWRL